MYRPITAAVLGLALVFGLSVTASAAKYTVYCTNGKTELDTRTPDQLKSARGSGTLATFDYKTNADKFAKQMNGQCPKKR